MLKKFKKVKRQFILAIFFSLAFIFPSTGIVSSVDALGNYECWTKNRRQHVSCLRAKLDSTPYGLTVPKARDGMGKYGCFNKKRRKHVTCLRGLLDQHGPHLAKGATGVVPPAATTTASPPPGRQEILAAEEAARAEQERLAAGIQAAPTPEQTAPPTATPTAPTAAERAQAGSEAPCAPRTYITRQRIVTAEEYIPELERKITCLKEAFRAPGYGDCRQTIVDCRANTSDHGDIPIEPPPCLSFPSSSPNAC